jgi:hypothetical protein
MNEHVFDFSKPRASPASQQDQPPRKRHGSTRGDDYPGWSKGTNPDKSMFV